MEYMLKNVGGYKRNIRYKKIHQINKLVELIVLEKIIQLDCTVDIPNTLY